MESVATENTVNVDASDESTIGYDQAPASYMEAYPEQDVNIWDEDWLNEPSQDIPPTEILEEVKGLDVPTTSHDTSEVKLSRDAPTEMVYWCEPATQDVPSTSDVTPPAKKIKLDEGATSDPALWSTVQQLPGEDIPPRKFKRTAQKPKVIKRWNLDRTTKAIVAPEGVRFLNATDFMLSAEEWQTWCEEWKNDTRELLLSEDRDDKCTLLCNEYGMELKRKRGLKTTKFYLSKYQSETLQRRAYYISAHLELLRENYGPIRIMKSVVAAKLMDLAAKMNLGMTYPSLIHETFDEALENAVSLGITSEVLRCFSSEMRIRDISCGLDHYSLFFYCMFQLSELRELVM